MRTGSALVLLALLVSGCAREEAPIGGPPDPNPPRLLRITPESGSVVRRPSEVEFRFDEVVSERPAGVQSLEQLFIISPRDGDARVRWRREALTVRPRRGWRDSTTYSVTILPGVADLRGNVRDSASTTVFSTGGPLLQTRITGVAFDWAAGTALANARILGITRPRMPGSEGDSAIYVATSDSAGRFLLPHVRPGEVTVIALNDANQNFAVDVREAFDSTSVTLRDSLHVELYAFVHDSLGPVPQGATLRDSQTVVIRFAQPLLPTDSVTAEQFTVVGPDSQPLPVVIAQRRAAFDSAQALADSLAAPADTAVRVQPDTLAAPADSLAVADTIDVPIFSRPIPATEIVIRLGTPLIPETTYEVRTRALRNLLGIAADGSVRFTTPAAATPEVVPPDSSAASPGRP